MLSNHSKIAKVFENKVKNPIKENLGKNLAKERPNLSSVAIFNFFATTNLFKTYDV